MLYSWLLLIHIAGACLIVGGGFATLLVFAICLKTPGFYPMLRGVARLDFALAGTGLLLQPASGLWLAQETGFSFADLWLATGTGLYAAAACLWLVGTALRNDSLKSGNAASLADRRLSFGFALSVLAWALLTATMAVMVLKP